MKIRPCDPKLQHLNPISITGKEKGQAPDFGKLLVEASERLRGTTPSDLVGSISIQHEGWKAMEAVLMTMEAYQEHLSSSQIPLKACDRIVQQLAEEVEVLGRLSEQLSQEDPLRKIMIEAGVLSAVEIEKFRRGDYL